jgi:hypothetical protein
MKLEIVGRFTVGIDVTPDGAVVFTVRPVQPQPQKEPLKEHAELGFCQLARRAGIPAGPVIARRLVDAWVALTTMGQVTPTKLATRLGISRKYAWNLLDWLVQMGLATRSDGHYSPSSTPLPTSPD